MPADGYAPNEDVEVVRLLDRVAARTAVPTWQLDVENIMEHGLRRRRRVRAGLAGSGALAASVLAVTLLAGTSMLGDPRPSETPVAQVAAPLLNAEGYRGPATFDSTSDEDGLCPDAADMSSEELGPAEVEDGSASSLLNAYAEAVAEQGLTTAVETMTVTRSMTGYRRAPCGPTYDLGLAQTADDSIPRLGIGWAGYSTPSAGGSFATACGYPSQCEYGHDAQRGARWGILDGDGAEMAVRIELVGAQSDLLSKYYLPAEPTTPTITIVVAERTDPQSLIELALAEDWHGLAMQVETDLVTDVPPESDTDGGLEAEPEPLSGADLSSISAAQAAEISDGTVSAEEYEAAFQRYRDCMSAAGYELQDPLMIDGVYSSPITPDAKESGVFDECYELEYQYTDRIWQWSPAIVDRSTTTRLLAECLEGRGVDPGSTREEIDDQLQEEDVDPLDCLP